jgi:antitoxin component YwqK of YwqJK toxin-antitoxin module
MRKLIFAFLLFLNSSLLLAQELTDSHINKVDGKGRRQGSWKVYDGDGNLKFTGNYVHGKPVGQFTYYYPTGKIKAVVHQEDSGRVARVINYHPDGVIMARGKYIGQKKDSTWLYYSSEDGTLSAEEHYQNTLKEGVWKTYFPEGGVAEEVTYRADRKDGRWIQYFTDGTVKMKTQYVNDQLEGLYVIYHLKGSVEISGSFVQSNKHGTWVYLDANGVLEKREEYENGKLISRQVAGTAGEQD